MDYTSKVADPVLGFMNNFEQLRQSQPIIETVDMAATTLASIDQYRQSQQIPDMILNSLDSYEAIEGGDVKDDAEEYSVPHADIITYQDSDVLRQSQNIPVATAIPVPALDDVDVRTTAVPENSSQGLDELQAPPALSNFNDTSSIQVQ